MIDRRLFLLLFFVFRRSVMWPLSLTALLLLAVWGCVSTTAQPSQQVCSLNSDCPSEHTCIVGYCRNYQRAAQNIVSLQLLLSDNYRADDNAPPLAKQHLLPLSLSSVHQKTLKALPSYRVRGLVRTRVDGEAILSKVRFVSRAHIPGQPLEWVKQTDQRGFYELRLTAGVYDVLVSPITKAWPTMRVAQVEISADLQKNWDIPRAQEYVQVTGNIVTARNANSNVTSQPIEELTVLLVSESGKAVSNLARTRQNGSFTLAYLETDKPVALRIQNKTEPFLHPMVEVPLSLIQKQAQTNKHPQTGQLLISYGALPIGAAVPTVTARGELRSNPEDGEQTVSGCHVRFTGKVVLGVWQDQVIHGTYSRTVISDSNGQYEVQLPRANFDVEVIPPPMSRWARGVFKSQSLQGGNLLVLSLQSKKTLSGTLCSQQDRGNQCNQTVKQAQVQAIWKGNLTSTTTQSYTASAQTHTRSLQGNGAYSLALDPGLYDLMFLPSLDSGLSPILVRNYRVSGKNNRLDILLPRANYIVATLQDPTGVPMKGVTVEMYEFINSDKGSATLLGRATTNAQGEFSIPYSQDMQRSSTK
jgi:hypothetical protein